MIDEALEHLVKGIVDNPEEVVINERDGRRGTTLEVRVHPDDIDRKSTRLNSSHVSESRMPSSA